MGDFNLLDFLAKVIALMIAIIGHEIMHGLSAYYYRDSTAKDSGRLSLNPIVHIDIVGTIIVPAMLFIANAPFLFGWAKPVPINMRTVISNGGYSGAVAVSLAGVTYNFILAIISATLLKISFTGGELDFLEGILLYLVIYNVVLGIFNLWPIPPLDGANALSFLFMKMKLYKVVEGFERVKPYGMIVLLLILATPLSEIFFKPAMVIIKSLL